MSFPPLISQIPAVEILFVLVQIGAVTTGIITAVKISKEQRARGSFSETPSQPDLLHRQFWREDSHYRRRIYEICVLLGLAGSCLVAAAVFGLDRNAAAPATDLLLSLYLASCGAGLEWWATGIAFVLVLRKFTATVEIIFIACVSFGLMLLVAVSLLITFRMHQLGL